MVLLKKPEQAVNAGKCIETIPNAAMESLLAPYMPQVKALSSALDNVSELANNLQEESTKLKSDFNRLQEQHFNLTAEFKIAQDTLNRRSVKLVLTLLHKFFALFSLKGN